MTYNFEEPEFPDAPKLSDFGLTPKEYEDLADVDEKSEAEAREIPDSKSCRWNASHFQFRIR